ncbi:MAG: phosphonate ABC transporter, permease protein PhnE [Candidatus Rokubacteria bacterium]|nr:phosphonate ABC transporter, permease protein PhnE [Candidatus Rokubacteria bacterium]
MSDTRATAGVGGAHWAWWTVAGFAALVAWSAHGTRVDVGALLGAEGLGQMTAYVAGLFPPDVSPPTLRDAALGAFETFAISFVGSVLAVGLGFSLALVASRTVLYRGILYAGERLAPAGRAGRIGIYALARGSLNALRTIPEILWALIFVFIVGLGPFAGVLALGVHTAGVLGKLFAEVIEDIDPRPIEALQATGASRLAIIVYGILPQAAPQFLSYALYRWEVNIRAAAVMGFVGAGGLGQRIHVAISLFHEHQLLTLLLAIYVIVTVVDALSAYLRARLL